MNYQEMILNLKKNNSVTTKELLIVIELLADEISNLKKTNSYNLEPVGLSYNEFLSNMNIDLSYFIINFNEALTRQIDNWLNADSDGNPIRLQNSKIVIFQQSWQPFQNKHLRELYNFITAKLTNQLKDWINQNSLDNETNFDNYQNLIKQLITKQSEKIQLLRKILVNSLENI